jgi:hypothetical protein
MPFVARNRMRKPAPCPTMGRTGGAGPSRRDGGA